MQRLFTLLGALLVGMTATSAGAHHSTANYVREKEVTITGKVTYFSFTNPHSFIDLDVEVDSQTVPHKVFATSRVVLLRYGWRPDIIKSGDEITVVGFPDRNDPTELYLWRITFADGTEWYREDILE